MDFLGLQTEGLVLLGEGAELALKGEMVGHKLLGNVMRISVVRLGNYICFIIKLT